MNRSVVIVKSPKKREYAVIRIHWNYGQPLADWLVTEYGSWHEAYELICQGHRSTIEEAHQAPEHQVFRTLRNAKEWCEHLTLAYHDGKRWRFEHREEG